MSYVYRAYDGLAAPSRRLIANAASLPALKRRVAHTRGLVVLVETLDGSPTDRMWQFRKAPGQRWKYC